LHLTHFFTTLVATYNILMEYYPIDKSKPVKIDLASGINYYKGKNNDEIDEWIHVDIDKAEHVEIQCNFAEGIPIESGIADEVHSSEFLEHIVNFHEVAIMSEFNRIMKIGCRFFGTTPNCIYSFKEFLAGRMDYDMMQRNLYGDRSNHYGHCHYRTFTEGELINFLERWGFGDINLSESPGRPAEPWWLVFDCVKVRDVKS